MTNAERIARWRERHAAKLARKAARKSKREPFTMDDMLACLLEPEDLIPL
jgi:hypothetical protein